MTKPLHEMLIAELQQRMVAGEISCAKLTAHFLNRIETIDRAGPTLNAVREVNLTALEIAAQLDAERVGGSLRGPLHGLPRQARRNDDQERP